MKGPLLRPYETDPKAIYTQSFATVRAEARLDRFAADLHPLMTRLIHACGMVEIVDSLAYSEQVAVAGRVLPILAASAGTAGSFNVTITSLPAGR